MNVLILSCNTGGGHNAAASALAERLEKQGHGAELVDFLALGGRGVSEAASGIYVELVKRAPALFGVVYGLGDLVSAADRALGLRSPVYAANARVAPALARYLAEHDFDAVVATHMFPAMALTEMKRRGMALPLTAALATDYSCIPFFQEADCDYLLLSSALCLEEFVRHGFPREKLVPLGIPVSDSFRERVGQAEARRQLGLPPDRRQVLVMGGSMGAGQIAQLTGCLLRRMEPDVGIIVVCGSNFRLQKYMERRYRRNSRVRILGYTDQVARYMEAGNLLYTKPGGITSTEGAVMGIPMVHMRPIPGCESGNRRVFTQAGMSVTARSARALAAKGRLLLDDPERQERMRRAQQTRIAADAAGHIVAFLERETGRGEK